MTSRLTVPTKRSAWALARGHRGGVFTTWMRALERAASNEAVNWAARSRMRNRRSSVRSPEVHHLVAGLLGGSCTVGVRGGAEDVDVAGGGFHHEEHVEALEGDRAVDVEEVPGQQARGLGVEEPPPGGVGAAPGSGWYPQALEYAPYGRVGCSVAELEQFALDPAVAPAGVLPRHALDQRHDGVVDRRSTGAIGVGPLFRDQAPVPSQDGSRCHQPVLTQPSGESANQRGEHRAIGPVQRRARVGPAQHGDLVPQHQQLDVLNRGGPAEQNQPVTESDEDQVQQS
ncbi:hypothetical protein AB0H12_41835 [Actinosynnema sp. NPDC023794]